MVNTLAINHMKPKINPKYHLPLFFLFCIIFFAILQFSFPNYLGHDAYYHVKVSQLIWEGKELLQSFPWLQNTILRDNFVEHHLLFHLILIPFVTILPPILGGKIAAILFSALATTTTYWLLRKLKVKFPLLWSLLLLFSSSAFIFRLNLLRAQSLALVLLLLGTYALIKKKHILLFIITFAYTWLFDGFIVLGITVGLYFAINFLLCLRKNVKHKLKKILLYLAPLGIFLGAMLTAILFNPYFPHNIEQLYFHLYKVAMHNSFSNLPVGGEWLAPSYSELLSSSLLVMVLYIISVAAIIIQSLEKRSKPPTKTNIFLLVAASSFLILTFIAQRMAEYWIIFTVILAATTFSRLWHDNQPSINKISKIFSRQKKVRLLSIIALAFFIITYGVLFVHKNIKQFDNYVTKHESGYKEAALWLKDNTSNGDIIYHVDWGDFPLLFFYSPQNYYVAGLDPNFMLEYDENTFNKWNKIFHQEDLQKMYSVIKYDFNSEYVLVTKKFPEITKHAESDPRFEKVYQSEAINIYHLKNY